MFGNPTASHWVQEKFKLPVLSIVFNNSRYGAVRRATLSMFKEGAPAPDTAGSSQISIRRRRSTNS